MMGRGWVAAVVLGVAALGALRCAGLPSSERGRPAAAAVAVEARRTTMDLWVPAQGYLEALKASPVAVPRVPTGALKVKELAPQGSIVERGDIVVVFDDTQLSIELDNHRATFRSADRRIDRTQIQGTIETGTIEVMKEVAEMDLDNATAFQILDEDIYSRQEILETEVKKEEAEETILFAEASLLLRGEYYDIEERILDVEKGQVRGKIERVETSLARLVLKAPIGGLIVYKKNWRGASVDVGDTLWPGNVIMSIVDPASAALTAFLLEKDAAGVEVGAPAEVRIDARPQHVFPGRVSKVAEVSRPIERNSPVKYFEVQVELTDADPGVLKPGMKGEARILAGRLDDAVVVPRAALLGDADRYFVMVDGEGGPEPRDVTLGLGDLVRVAIVSGLEGGERVLLGAASSGLPGAKADKVVAEAAGEAPPGA